MRTEVAEVKCWVGKSNMVNWGSFYDRLEASGE